MMFQKSVLIISATLAATAAVASDLPAPMPMSAEPVEIPFTWTGFRAGIQAGYLKKHAILEDLASDTNLLNADFDKGGVTLGMFAGFDYQFEQGFVLGIEADLNWDGLKTGETAMVNASTGVVEPDQFANATLKWDSSVRARIGYALDRFMPYITGGIAYGQLEHGRLYTDDANAGAAPESTAYDTRLVGWTLGGGFEYAFTQYILARVEYRYTKFHGENYAGGVDVDDPGNPGNPNGKPDKIGDHDVELTTQSIKAGIAMKF